MPFGYIGQNQTKQKVKNSGVLSSFDISLLEKNGQASGSLEHIQTITASSSTIDFVDKFSNHDVHLIELVNCIPTAQTEFGIRFSNDSGSSYETSNYQFSNLRRYSNSSTLGERESTSQGTIRLGGDITTYTNSVFNSHFYIYNANNSAKFTFITSQSSFTQGGIFAMEFGGGVYIQADTVNGIRIGQSASAIAFTSGTAKLYGVKQ